ncbi:MAG: hemolysin family protein [Sphingomonas sp.]|uniref:hemolysin family protein n=1 Tax=Sphingomonas sp. TaxID=28214 RepID=UPI0025D1FE2F|nr:hemolysin family protein [Sphingomonas sp.]MBX9882269.1 hemolysin family protein [Sphingomonas sp.]
MQPFPWIDLAIIIALVLLNGVFAASELAIVSARRARLEAMVRAKRRGAASALRLAGDPGKLLSTVQIGITLIAVISGAYSGASLGGPVTDRLRWLGMSAGIAETLAIVLVIGLTTFLSLVIGELVPKRLALRRPEPIAVVVAAPMIWLSRAAAPLVWLLDGASGALFWLLRLPGHAEDHVTAEELQLIVAEASKSGVIEEHERTIISGVVRLADRPVREVMTPRTDVEWLDADLDEAGVRQALMASGHSRLPVAEGSVDAVIGVVQARDVAQALFRGEALNLRALMRPAPVVLDQIDAMDALDTMRAAEVPMALIHDEYGHFEGIVTPANLLAAIAGEFASDADPDDAPAIVERDDGSLLVAGQTAADLLAERLGINLPENRDYATVAGLALAVFRHLPGEGESFTLQGWRFEVVDLDGRRIDKLLVSAA